MERFLGTPAGTLLETLGIRVTEAGAARIRNGNPGEVLDHTDYGAQVWASRGGRPLCVGRYFGGTVQPERVFNF